jgi:hypothetical protein
MESASEPAARHGATPVMLWRSVPKGVAALAVAVLLVVATAPVVSYGASLPWEADENDPARAARDVFQDQDFWWKRIEQRSVSSSWLETIVTALLDFVGRILNGILDLIGRILRFLFGIFGGTSSGGAVAIWLVIFAILAWSSWRFYRWIASRKRGGIETPRALKSDIWQPLAEDTDLFEQAGQALREGGYAEAIRLALLALIARLEKQGLLHYDPTRTNREYQRELRHSSELAVCFGQVARIYEFVWYGRAAAGHTDAEEAIRLTGSVINRKEPAPE